MTATNYHQGEYAGPHTVRAMDYNGHEAIGVQISDEAPDGSVFLVTIDKHMQFSIAPVITASMREYEPAEPPPVPELAPEDYAATRRNLEDLLSRMLSHGVDGPDQLRACAIAMHELADVVDAQIRLEARPHAGQAPGQVLDAGSSADIPSAERCANAEQKGSAFTAEVGSASLAERTEVQP